MCNAFLQSKLNPNVNHANKANIRQRWQCLNMTEDASTKTTGPPGMSSLYNVDFNDKLVNIACLTPAQTRTKRSLCL